MIGIIIGLAGAIGSGKSFSQLKNALQYANDRNKSLVFNFDINIKELYIYASMPKAYQHPTSALYYDWRRLVYYICKELNRILPIKIPCRHPRTSALLPWVQHLCKTGGISQIPAPKYLESLMIPESVICLDEAGILLNSRNFAQTSMQLLADLSQSRKDGCDLFWAAQFEEQVDKQMRLLTQYWIHCDSLAVYDKKLRRPKLVFKNIYWFKACDYLHWLSNPRDRSSYFKKRFAYSIKGEEGTLSISDKQLFKVFNSFNRLDYSKVPAKIVTRDKCFIPNDFYFNNLNIYLPQFDPFSKKYQPLWGYYSLKKSVAVSDHTQNQNLDSLIKQALALSRAKNIKPPFFKSMKPDAISKWMALNK